jgi:hypothetical protein
MVAIATKVFPSSGLWRVRSSSYLGDVIADPVSRVTLKPV